MQLEVGLDITRYCRSYAELELPEVYPTIEGIQLSSNDRHNRPKLDCPGAEERRWFPVDITPVCFWFRVYAW